MKSDTCREKLKSEREVYRRSDVRQEVRSCICSGWRDGNGGGGMSSAITQNQDIRMVVSLSSGDHYHRSTSTCPYPRVYCHKALPRIDADLLCLKYHQPVFQVITNVFLQK